MNTTSLSHKIKNKKSFLGSGPLQKNIIKEIDNQRRKSFLKYVHLKNAAQINFLLEIHIISIISFSNPTNYQHCLTENISYTVYTYKKEIIISSSLNV